MIIPKQPMPPMPRRGPSVINPRGMPVLPGPSHTTGLPGPQVPPPPQRPIAGQMQTGQLTQPDPNAGPGRQIAQTMPGGPVKSFGGPMQSLGQGQFESQMVPVSSGQPVMKKGGKVKKMASGGTTSKSSSASKRADGIAQRGKTKGRIC